MLNIIIDTPIFSIKNKPVVNSIKHFIKEINYNVKFVITARIINAKS